MIIEDESEQVQQNKKMSFADINFKIPHAALFPSIWDTGMMCFNDTELFVMFMKDTWIDILGALCHITKKYENVRYP